MALLSQKIPEHHRKVVGLVVETHVLGLGDKGFVGFAGRRNAGKIAFDVSREHRHPGA